MIRKLLVAGVALAALGIVTSVSQPAEAGAAVVSAKARGLKASEVSDRSAKKLTHHINHWAHKNKLKTVRVGKTHTSCSNKGPLTTCVSSAKVKG